MCSGKPPLFRELARRRPDTQVVVDHVGLIQPPEPQEPFADLPNLTARESYTMTLCILVASSNL